MDVSKKYDSPEGNHTETLTNKDWQIGLAWKKNLDELEDFMRFHNRT
jgi:hypothetical protein